MTITLQAIENEHARIATMIEEFKRQPRPSEYRVDAVTIPLAAGERFAGAVLNDDGTLQHYLILLPRQADDVSWTAALEWAAEQGGELPTRREQSLLFANLKTEFDESCYWSAERHEENSGWAWCQRFLNGRQDYYCQNNEFRARAVRRFIPSVI